MSAFRGGKKPNSCRGTGESLIKLVEDYLLKNSHQYFVNLDQMGEHIRSHSFRFARMKNSAFKEQLKKAYQQYTESKAKNFQDFSGNDIVLDDTPLDEETLKQMEGDPSDPESDDNDGLMIDETIQMITTDAGASQMKNLYTSSPLSAPSKPSTTDPNYGYKKADQSQQGLGKELTIEIVDTAEGEGGADSADCISISSAGSAHSKSNDFTKVDAEAASSNPTYPLPEVPSQPTALGGVSDVSDDSGSDLEIIEEVNKSPSSFSKSSVIVISKVSGSDPPLPLGGTRSNRIFLTTTPSNSVAEAQLVHQQVVANGSMKVKIPTDLKVVEMKGQSAPAPMASSKGVKRKVRSTDGSQTGINEDFTRKRPRKEVTVVHDTGYKLKDFAGSEKVVEDICKLLMHLKHPEIYQTLGVSPPRGFLLHGPPGTGKTLLANAVAGEMEMPMLKVAGTELVSGISGESESNIRELFNQAVAVAPCIVFIDEIDSVTPKRENANKDMERRIVAQLLACIDDLVNKEKGGQVLLIGATNRIDSIDTALRRAGRFDREISLGIPDEESRAKILSVICRDLRLEPGFNVDDLARLTPGYVGADLQALVREAAVQAVNRKIISEKYQKQDSANTQPEPELADAATQEMEVDLEVTPETTEAVKDENIENPLEELKTENGDIHSNSVEEPVPNSSPTLTNVKKEIETKFSPLTWIRETSPLTEEQLRDLFMIMKDFELAMKNVQPSSKREGFATVPDITWDDIGALQDIRDELQVSILGPVKHAEAFKKLGLNTPAGVLLCGPPGCGKTLLAKAVANEARINFISVKGPELLNMYVGESERAVRQCFTRARHSSPCVIFFDELDALCPRRSDIADSGSGGRIVNQLLTEMDGMESRQGVFVMAATNRPDIIDPAVLRPGRLDKILFVNLPTPKDRYEILKAITKNSTRPVLDKDVNLEEIAESPECENYTGADLSALVREASIASFRELVLHNTGKVTSDSDLKVYKRHFMTAFSKTKPSVGKEERMKYNKMAEKYSSAH